MELNAGEIVALVGPSGAGKSSLLHIASLLEAPSSGEIYIDGAAASRLPDSERTRIRRDTIGFVYQAHHLLPEFHGLENVVMPQMIAGVSRKEAGRGNEKGNWGAGAGQAADAPAGAIVAASSSASPLPAPWPTNPRFCWPTSLPVISTRAPPAVSLTP